MNDQANMEELDGAPPPPTIGEVIAGKYRVESVVGTGGMGIVLCATHLDLGQRVAIKVLTIPEDDARRDEARERFLREGRATAALVSDHVVRIYDVGTLPTGAPFMVMELLRGRDLARTLQQDGPLSIELACNCVRQAADAISTAHAQGIVHRDLKPSNLFLTQRSDGAPLVKVLDFGISKTLHSELEPLTGNLTATRSVLGTPFYMSPEQVRDAKKVDVRTDIWSLGLILHELLTASPAFEGTTLPGVCAAIAADPPAALRLKRPEVPVEVEAIVLKCLEKDPARRFQSARELADRLAPWTGRTDSALHSPLSDQTIRSSPLFEAELQHGATVALVADSGTLASAVFTQSGERVVAGVSAQHSKAVSTLAPPAPSSKSVPAVALSQRKRALLGAGVVALIGAVVWLAWSRSDHDGATASAPPIAPSLSAAAQPELVKAAPQSFSLQIDSSPPGAQVFEGDALLGSTPLQIKIGPAGSPPHTFVLRKLGFLPARFVQQAEPHDTRISADLVPEPSVRPAASPPATHPRALKTPPVLKPPPPPAKPGNDIFMQR